jgi:hypothetical protein
MQTRTAPVNEADSKRDKQLLEALGRSKLYRQFESTFSEATGLPLMLRPVTKIPARSACKQ